MPEGARAEEIIGRIGILEQQVLGLVESRAKDLLKKKLHVPATQIETCLKRLVDRVRAVLLGEAERTLTREEITAIARKHGGAPLPTQQMAEFVPPTHYASIQAQFQQKHFAVLVGQPGAGKTLVAEMLAFQLRTSPVPYEVLRRPGLAQIQEALLIPDEQLFYLEDPWGKDRLDGDAHRWASELPRLLDQATEKKKFLVTSRVELLQEAMGKEKAKELLRQATRLTYEDYDDSARRRILLGKMRSAQPWQQDFVRDSLSYITNQLRAPLSLEVFARHVKRAPSRDAMRLNALLAACSVGEIATIVAQEVRALSWKAVPPALVVWSLLRVTPTFQEEEALQRNDVLRAQNPAIESAIHKFLDWMRSTGWLSVTGEGEYRAHPVVITGLEKLLDEEPDSAGEVMRALLTGLLRAHEIEAAFRIARHLPPRRGFIPPAIRAEIGTFLRERLLQVDGQAFGDAFYDAVEWPSGDDPVTTLVQGLVNAPKVPPRGLEATILWVAPEWTDETLARVRQSDDAQRVAQQFIRWVFPHREEYYSEDLHLWLARIGWDLTPAFHDAFEPALRSASLMLEEIVKGALIGDRPAFDSLIDKLLDALAEWRTEYEQGDWGKHDADEEVLDAAYAEHLYDLQRSRISNLSSGLNLVIAERRRREGYTWLMAHPRRAKLLSAWSHALVQAGGTVGVEELQAFHEACKAAGVTLASQPIKAAQCKALAPLVLEEFVAAIPRDLNECIRAACSLLSPEELGNQLREATAKLPQVRRAELALMTRNMSVDAGQDWRLYREEVLKALITDCRKAVMACDALLDGAVAPAVMGELGPDEQRSLEDWALHASGQLRAAALRLLSLVRQDLLDVALDALASKEEEVRLAATEVLSKDSSARAHEALRSSLADPHYRCRAAAVLALGGRASQEERTLLLKAAEDPSAPVRAACARVVGEQKWPEGIKVLVGLLADRRDQAGAYPYEPRDHHVARAAARSLQAFVPLPAEIIDALVAFVGKGRGVNEDIEVHRALLNLLAPLPHHSVEQLLLRLLRSQWSARDLFDVTYPLRYAAVHGLLTHVEANPQAMEQLPLDPLLWAATHSDAELAGPAIFLLGRLGQRTWDGAQEVLITREASQIRSILFLSGSSQALRKAPSNPALAVLADQPLAGLLLEWLEGPGHEPRDTWEQRWRAHPEGRRWLARLLGEGPWGECLRQHLEHRLGDSFKQSMAQP
jgi:HEAT repeat protein